MTELKKPIVPLELAVQIVSDLMERIDEGDLSQAIQESFGSALDDIAKAVDRRRSAAAFIRSERERANDLIAEAKDYMSRLDRLEKGLKEDTQAILEAHPDLPWKGSTGKKVWVQGNTPALKFSFELASKSVSGNRGSWPGSSHLHETRLLSRGQQRSGQTSSRRRSDI